MMVGNIVGKKEEKKEPLHSCYCLSCMRPMLQLFFFFATGGKVKKSWKGEYSLEMLQSKFSSLSYFDQHSVVSSGLSTVTEMLASFISSSGSHLPLPDHLAFLFSLMENALYIHGMLEFSVQVRTPSTIEMIGSLGQNILFPFLRVLLRCTQDVHVRIP